MKDSQKNRCPEAARKRAVADARCALRKLDILARLEAWSEGASQEDARELLAAIAQALGVKS